MKHIKKLAPKAKSEDTKNQGKSETSKNIESKPTPNCIPLGT